MLKPGKIFIIAACAVLLMLLVSCAAGRYWAPVEPDPAPLETTAAPNQSPEPASGQVQDSPEPSDEPVEEIVGEPVEEAVGEPLEEPNPIPFFVPDPDPDDPNPTPVPIPEHDTIPIPFLEKGSTAPAVSRKTSDPDKFSGSETLEEDAPYFGRWIIQSRGIDVACYLNISQEVVDTEDAASFFQYGDQYVIADHSNQDFRSLDSCQPGDLACLEKEDGVAVYVCTAVFQGHNTEDSILDEAGNSIEYGYNAGGITCYTCNDNWQNIHVALFSPLV